MRGELGLEVGRVGAAGGLHLHAGLDERAQLVGQALQVGALAQQHEDRLDRVGAVEGRVSGGGEDQHRAEREHVAGPGDAAGVLGLLRGHVGGGADGDVRHGQTGVRNAGRDTEVDHAGAVLDHEDVGGLQVAVDQARAVDRLERLRDAGGQPAHRLGRQRPALVHYLLEGGCGHVGRGQPGHRGAGVGVDHGRRVEAGDRAGRLHLAGEADAEQLVLRQFRAHRLDRHAPPGRRAREIDQPHAAGAEPAQHLERPDPPRIVLRQLIHHLPATSPYGPRHPHMYATEVQRLTTAPPWRHAPRFFLSEALVANLTTIGVSSLIPGKEPSRDRSRPRSGSRPPLSAAAARTTPPDRPRPPPPARTTSRRAAPAPARRAGPPR
ncbi:hypothetical protein BZZ08_06987 [Streptomyces sp. MH60]|nr:hypothetical protein BZZ08_06987 [Streptomyces sp. MH60]